MALEFALLGVWWVVWAHQDGGQVRTAMGVETSSTPAFSLTCCVTLESHITSLNNPFLIYKRTITLSVQFNPLVVVRMKRGVGGRDISESIFNELGKSGVL